MSSKTKIKRDKEKYNAPKTDVRPAQGSSITQIQNAAAEKPTDSSSEKINESVDTVLTTMSEESSAKKRKGNLIYKIMERIKAKKSLTSNAFQKNSTKENKTTEEKITQELAEERRRSNKQKKKKKRRITKILDETLEKSGYEIRGDAYQKKAKRAGVLVGIIITLIISIAASIFSHPLYFSLSFMLLSFILISLLTYFLIIIGSFIFFDYIVYKRTKEIEEVLPEFLQLASANISAGMPIDRALWFAVRPKFGILAKEIEEVAKSNIAGEGLEQALETFTKKYDSKILRESMNLLIEGMRAGGEIGYLLNQIAANMQDIKIMRKEISASVMSYVIFITAASIIGAPFLLALSSQLLVVMTGIASSVNLDDSSGSSSSTFKISMSADSISLGDFKIFAVVVLLFSSIFSAMIISVIRRGNTNESLKIIPVYILVSLVIFFLATLLFSNVMGPLFQ